MRNSEPTFRNRAEAGRRLAIRLGAMELDRPAICALPRGGVPVAIEIARALKAQLGAIVEGHPPQTILNERIRQASGVGEACIERASARELIELERRHTLYLGNRARIDPAGRTVILVDDGLATAATMKAALAVMRRHEPAWIVVAVPVAPEEVTAGIEDLADTTVCLAPIHAFRCVGAFFAGLCQQTGAETIGLLDQGLAR